MGSSLALQTVVAAHIPFRNGDVAEFVATGDSSVPSHRTDTGRLVCLLFLSHRCKRCSSHCVCAPTQRCLPSLSPRPQSRRRPSGSRASCVCRYVGHTHTNTTHVHASRLVSSSFSAVSLTLRYRCDRLRRLPRRRRAPSPPRRRDRQGAGVSARCERQILLTPCGATGCLARVNCYCYLRWIALWNSVRTSCISPACDWYVPTIPVHLFFCVKYIFVWALRNLYESSVLVKCVLCL